MPRRDRQSELTSLEVVEEAFPAPASDEIAVRVTASVLDPLSLNESTRADLPEVAFAGVISDVGPATPKAVGVGQDVIGIGPMADLVGLSRSEVWFLPADSHLSPQQAAVLPYLCSFLHVLRTVRIEPEARILITGHPVIRHLSEQLLSVLLPEISATQISLEAGHEIATEMDRPFDVLVHGVTDPLDLQLSLSALREDGEAFLLVPPGRHVLPLDFYPHIHRSCLRLLVRRVGNPCRPASCPEPGHPLLSQLFEQERIDVDPVLSPVSNAAQLASLPLEEIIRSEKLLAVAWP